MGTLAACSVDKRSPITAQALRYQPPAGVHTLALQATGIQRKADCACGGGCPRCRENINPSRFDVSRSNQDFVRTETTDSLSQPLSLRARRVELRRGPAKDAQKDVPAKKQDKPTAESPAKKREACDQKCGTVEGTLGNTECELNLKSGFPTRKVVKEIFDKNPCTRPCVDEHESVHVKHLTPICAEVDKCIDNAGKDSKQQDKCLDAYDSKLWAKVAETECAAYSAEEKCLEKRKSDKNCVTEDGKKRWNTQMNMVKCYKGCFCGG